MQQDNLTALVRTENPSELSELGLQAAATQLSQFFLTSQAAHLLASDPKEYHRRVTILAKVSVQLKALQKYRDDCGKSVYQNPERLRREAQREVEHVRRTFSCAEIPDDPDTPETPHRNYLPKPS